MSLVTRRTVLRLLGTSAAVAGGAGLVAANEYDNSDLNKDLATVRRATKQYHDEETAIEDGYVRDDHCVSNPFGEGAMGYHYVNFGLVDDSVDLENPEGLVYEERGGKRHLVAVEYISTSPFTLFGRESHPPNAVPFYTLHVWVWKANPEGTFADFNPTVRCPPEHA
ncbi:hypothetical protein [Haloferax sp. YSMS24]|uniref:hypothetical protein n=1 Tax=unclassified Haloferax TaxID=2625095 RepID=UPI00398CD638